MPKKTRQFLNQQVQKSALLQMETMHTSRLLPWLSYHHGVSLYESDGAELPSVHLAYTGAPRTEFLSGYIDPFLKGLENAIYAEAMSLADEYGVSRRAVIQDTRPIILSVARKTFRRMAEIDRRLLIADGLPSTSPHDWGRRYQAYQQALGVVEASFLHRSKKQRAIIKARLLPLGTRWWVAAVAALAGTAAILLAS